MKPTWMELLTGPFTGVSIYPRAAAVPPRATVLALAGVLALLTGVIAGTYHLRIGALVDDLRNSALWLMPRVNVADGVARVESAPGRTLHTDILVLVLDTSIDRLEVLPIEPDDPRMVVHVSRRHVIIHHPGMPQPVAHRWAEVGNISLDGPELVDYLDQYFARIIWPVWAAGSALLAAWQLLLIVLFVGLYRTLFFRGLYVPRFGSLVSVGCVAAVPGVTLGMLLFLAGLPLATVFAAHALTSGALFFVAATRVRLGDERPDLQPIAPAAPNPEPTAVDDPT